MHGTEIAVDVPHDQKSGKLRHLGIAGRGSGIACVPVESPMVGAHRLAYDHDDQFAVSVAAREYGV